MSYARLALIVAFIGLMTWLWLPYFNQADTQLIEPQDSFAVPDYVAHDLSQTSYNKQGGLSHKVTAKQMELFTELGFTHFKQPVFTLYNKDKHWQLSADKATLYDNNRLVLEYNVVAKNLQPNALIEQINTNLIEIDIDGATMSSSHQVTLTGPAVNIVAKGLTADMNTEIIELINHTRTIYYDQ